MNVPIQPMWKERTDLIGYYNEFTKKFNETTLLQKLYEANCNDEIYITNVRQRTALQSALSSFQLVQQSIEDGMPEDFYSIDLMSAYEDLGSIIGEAVGEDLVNEIFSKFCMGK